MALTTQSATIGGATKTLIVAADGSSNIAAAHVTVDSSGAEKGVTGNPLAISAAALPLPTGAATAALQPAINADGGALAHVTNFPATQPVSGTVAVTGTFWQATQPVSLTALPALAAGANAIGSVSVSNLPATQAVSAASLPLPTGAATSAKQPALGAAGTPATDVLTVQGAAAMTALKVDGSATTQPVSAASLPLPAGAATAALQPAINADGGAQTHVMNFPATQPVSAAALPLPAGAATAAKQPALGTAGAASADVLTVQGAASMTALKVDGSAVTQPVIQAGGTGTDYSANTATAITAAQATTLLATIPVTATRAYVEVQNQSAATVSLVRDDGAGANQVLILLAPGSGAGTQGGGWSSATFKGRVRVYGASGAQVAAYQE